VLSLSQLDVLTQIEAPRWFSLSELAADALADMQYEAEQADFHIEADVDSDCLVYGDEELVRAAVENIVRNAIKYAGGGGLIHLQVRRGEEGGCMFRVSDNGPGIPEHELTSVLRPFYRADRLRHWQQEGSGIGLAIADRAVKLHGGTILIRNRPSGGLDVEIRLPDARHDEARARAAYVYG
jgi:two-component system sensor histidine kinase CpxA